MKVNDNNLVPWVLFGGIGDDIFLESAHCNCMAGLGEACSHIGALLFYLEYDYRYTLTEDIKIK